MKLFSHDKFIKEPEPGVVFISRRDGLVPLNSLGTLHNYHTPVILVSN